MNDSETDWTELREFKALNLLQSYVLSWDIVDDDLQVDADLNLSPHHALYEEPRPAEKACYRAASIIFPLCSFIAADAAREDLPLAEAASSLNSGRISGLRRVGEGKYRFEGEFGSVTIMSERPMVRLKDPTI